MKPKRGHGLIGIKVHTTNPLAGILQNEKNLEGQETGKITIRKVSMAASWL